MRLFIKYLIIIGIIRYLVIIGGIALFVFFPREKEGYVKTIEKLPKMITYVSNPNPSDSTCIAEIEKAKIDIQNGKLVFAQQYGFLFGELRYENELRQLCKEFDLEFKFDHIGCVIYEGQTQGCYGYYMDKTIIEKYGRRFKKELHEKADSIFLLNINLQNQVVQYWDCDERPRLPSEKSRKGDYLPGVTVTDIDIKKGKLAYGSWPFFDIGFTVEKDSTVSNFYVRGYVPQVDDNENLRNELFSITVKYIQANYPRWVPGKIRGTPVCTDNNVRISLKKE